jgi:hypothetical protein
MKMFREFLVYHHSSLEFRAKLLTLMVSSSGDICECEMQKLNDIAYRIYINDHERAELLVATVKEYHQKIITNNGLNFDHLIQLVAREVRGVNRFSHKIDIATLMELHECVDENDEENLLFQIRIIEFLENLKVEYGGVR